MKIQLDTAAKTIRVEDVVDLGEFFEIIQRLLPDGTWREFKLEPRPIIDWTNPIIIEPYVPYTPLPYVPYTPYPTFPWWQQPITVCDGLISGTYNIQV
jgi:hypothetical protein